jgi:hypothetical protein
MQERWLRNASVRQESAATKFPTTNAKPSSARKANVPKFSSDKRVLASGESTEPNKQYAKEFKASPGSVGQPS